MMDAIEYTHKHRNRFIDELVEFLRIPSISTQAEHHDDMQKAAGWLRDKMLAAGMTRAELIPTAGHPLVYGEWLAAGPDAPTVLLYGHYDVQPPDPVELWRTPPFEPTIVGDDLFARGSADDKGQLYIHVKVLEALKNTAGVPPINIKCIAEGEEEIGSEHLGPAIIQNRDLLAADVALISDSHILGPHQPAIVYGLRGMCYVEIEVTGPAGDLHSGSFGGAVHNPIHALAEMISKLHDENGHITIPGFYDKVRPLESEEREELARIPFDRAQWLQEAGVSSDWGEKDYSIVERLGARPTLDANGIWGGYIQPGAKTVLPSKAFAKISMRLVPDQDPHEIYQLIRQYLTTIAPPTVSVKVRELHGAQASIMPRNSIAMKAAFEAYRRGFGAEPVFMREGGSIPVVATFKQELNIDTILMGFGLPDDNLHAPNEKFHLPNFERGMETSIHFMNLLAEAWQGS